jgi:hypothetical protein
MVGRLVYHFLIGKHWLEQVYISPISLVSTVVYVSAPFI